jgi:hypothetical protein
MKRRCSPMLGRNSLVPHRATRTVNPGRSLPTY